jgi:hypothetical protein
MAFWDGVGDFFSEHGADIAVGAVSVAGFAVGGPLGAAVAGGIAGGVAAGFKDENILVGAGLGVAGGLVGGLGGVAFRGSAKGVVGGLLRQGRSLDIAQGMGSTAEKIAFQRSGLFAKRIPEMLGGAHLSPWKTYMGLFGAAFTPQTMDFIEGIPDKWHQHTGYPEIPLIDISAEELSEIPADMPHIMMPDPARLPEGLELTAPVEENYRTLPPAYKAYWNSFGEKPGKLDPPKELDVADISGEDKAGIANYPQKVEEMRKRFADLRSEASKIDELNDQTGLLCDAGRRDFTAVVQALERFAELDARGLKFIDRLQSEYSQKTSEYSGLPVFEVNTKIMSTGPRRGGLRERGIHTYLVRECVRDAGRKDRFREVGHGTEKTAGTAIGIPADYAHDGHRHRSLLQRSPEPDVADRAAESVDGGRTHPVGSHERHTVRV